MTDPVTHAAFSNRAALVTGASRGIGRAIALALAASGAAVAVNCRERLVDALDVVAEIQAAGGRAIAVGADVSDGAAVAAMVDRVCAELGPIDVLVNNAGIAIIRGIDDLTEDEFDTTIAVNLNSAFLCTKAVLPAMIARKSGSIICMTSIAAKRQAPAEAPTSQTGRVLPSNPSFRRVRSKPLATSHRGPPAGPK